MAAKAWGGRFQQQTDARVEAFTESISFDSRLAAVDIQGSQAHARMLARVGLISDDECTQIVETLTQIGNEIEAGNFEFRFDLEDIHMHIESALIERVGDVGRKLHTARSRNDQVSTDLKLYTREAIHRVDGLLKDLQTAFVERCGRDQDLVLPGFTHLQRAQPVKAAHYWLAYCEKFDRDRQRLADCLKRVNVSPLGGAALAGTSLPIDRHYTAELLEFTDVARNSLDISSDRDYLAEFCFCMALIATHLSNWAEEWIAWFSTEFGFIKLPDAFTTGSSIMPQKRNPDVLELIRGKSARPIADVQQILVLLKGLPMAYNRDMQEDKLALFDAYDTVAACLELAAAMVEGAELQQETIANKLEDGFLDATALMEYLIKKGTPMRTGHGIVGKLVSVCESRSIRLVDLPLEELQQACPQIEEDIYQVLGARNAMAALCSFGSGGEVPVQEQTEYWKEKLGL
ncbi:argininosuccinate lyase [Gimesia maris]|uniref:Argininosuccinate lyase n=1 Tax=Gimesia maris TaxID=122 RepID=A0ABX5YPU7_9PLAN|nr:argininosuccinate lyase [Gimesia maris]EDL60470.1 argininosuccinate lyase [Gimesia maris DSM 8797]QEG17771.1 Argininosuccinate lyase [Gimesia maris]QGQ29190.1 argininosuccinate lyase [Gimesia maris]